MTFASKPPFSDAAADHRQALLESRLKQARQPDGCLLIDLDVTRCRDGSMLISTPHPIRTVIGLPQDSGKGLSKLICTAAEQGCNLDLGFMPTVYILDMQEKSVIKKENEEITLQAGKSYKLLVAPQGATPDFNAAFAQVIKQDAAPKP